MENEKQEKLKKILKKAVDIKKNSDLAIAREFVDLDEKIESEFDELEEKIEIINESLKKKLESELVLEIDREELKGDKGDKGNKGDKGDKGDTKIVEKIIEKREIIKEQPIVYKNITNEIKEVAKYEERDQIVTKINSGKDKDIKIEAKQITGLPEFTREVVREVGSVGHIETTLKAGNNVTITTDGTGAKVISANQDLDSVDSIQFDINATPLPNAEGLLQWNATDGTLDLGMDGGEITQQIGQELFTKVRNQSGSTILNGRAVYFSGRLGNRPLISLAKSDAESTSRVAGITTEDIISPDDGFITTAGYVRGIKTDYTGSGIWGTTWVEGDLLYVSKTDAGVLTNVEPTSPHHSDIVGSVGIVHSSLGSILVSLDRHKTLAELSDVDGSPLVRNGQLPIWDNDRGVFDFEGDVDLGNHTLTAGGTQAGQSTIASGLVVNDSGGNGAADDFRAETVGNPNAFVVDASADKILIGEAVEMAKTLNVTGTTKIGGTTGTAKLNVQSTGTDDILNLIETGGTEVMTVLENGNVGIGIVSPTAKLSVERSETVGGTLFVDTIINNTSTITGQAGVEQSLYGLYIKQNNNISTTGGGKRYGILIEQDGAWNKNIGTESVGLVVRRVDGTVYGNYYTSAVFGNGIQIGQDSYVFGGASLIKLQPTVFSSSNTGEGTIFMGNGTTEGDVAGITAGQNTANLTAAIHFVKRAANRENDIVFKTSNDGNLLERARILGSNGNVGIGTTSPDTKLQVVGDVKIGEDITNYAQFGTDGTLNFNGTAKLDIINSDVIRLRTSKTPASASATGNAGDICWDSNYIYVCVATDTWKRSALSTW